MRHLPFPALIGLLCSGAVLSAAQSPDGFLHVRSLDDLEDTRANVPVGIYTPLSGGIFATDEDGLSPALPIPSASWAICVVGESLRADALLLGQLWGDFMPAFDVASPSSSLVVLSYHQPAAPLTHIHGGETRIEPPGHHAWSIQTLQGSDDTALSFYAYCGLLLSEETIDSWLQFNQVAFPGGAYDRAFVFRRAPLAGDPAYVHYSFVVAIDCTGLGYTQQPSASALVLANTDDVVNPSSFSAKTVGMLDQTVYVWVKGTLAAGDNVVLLDQGPGMEQSLLLPKSPMLVDGGDSSAAAPGDCEPRKPAYSGPTGCPPPPGRVSCGETASEPVGLSNCTTKVTRMSLTCDPSLTKPPPDEMHLWDLGQSYRTGDYGGVIIKRLPPSYYVMPDSGFGFCHATWEHKVTCTQDWTEYVEELVYRQDEEGVVEYGWDCIRRVVSKTCGRANAVLETTSCPRTGP